MEALIIKTLFVLVTLALTIIMIGSLLAVFVSPLLAVACFVGSLVTMIGVCQISAVYETRGE